MKMHDQKLFETVARHLFAQGQKALDANGSCVYRGPNDTKCAVGCLIPDDMYDEAIEGHTFQGIYSEFQNIRDIFRYNNYNLIRSLQRVHDSGSDHSLGPIMGWETTANMRNALNTVATKYGLDGAFLSELSFKDR